MSNESPGPQGTGAFLFSDTENHNSQQPASIDYDPVAAILTNPKNTIQKEQVTRSFYGPKMYQESRVPEQRTKIQKNPTQQTLARLIAKSTFGCARAFMSPAGDFYAWDSAHNTHNEIISLYGFPEGDCINLLIDNSLDLAIDLTDTTIDQDEYERKPNPKPNFESYLQDAFKSIPAQLIANPHIQRLFPVQKSFSMTIRVNGGEDFQFFV